VTSQRQSYDELHDSYRALGSHAEARTANTDCCDKASGSRRREFEERAKVADSSRCAQLPSHRRDTDRPPTPIQEAFKSAHIM